MFIVFLDLETIGLPILESQNDNNYPSYKELNKYDNARIIQIALIIGDQHGNVIKKHNYIIRPDAFKVANTHIHGISEEIAMRTGISFSIAIEHIGDAFKTASLLVAHNIAFDKNVLLSELYRYKLNKVIKQVKTIPEFCTCCNSADITRIGLYGTKHFKLPKLSELYFFLFNKNADGLHDAIVDTTVMLECFYEMLRRNYIKLV